ncbi:YqaJ viral recombinase family protein [Chryseobacterium sp. MHB01]|uniref:YqaJ viral recombinase family protein n=1 Tax=Chryseobacterium sp. MHB01 TaxID=3109433 RepID=UPI002AFE72F4|nr:YqaJ viral recombinase family protein [Chryseobacterium sp. MHB01]MEA1848988.1 YqaJ viral recombinase family protein [Chryseobacterium sp. MHB01]
MDFPVKNNLPDLFQAVVSNDELDKRELWFQKRLGKFTSSELSRLMTYEDNISELPKGAITYIEEKALEILTGGKSVKNFTNDSMERGNEKELEAIAVFEEMFGVKCYATGEDQEFIELCSYFGGTPDGLIAEEDMIEVKCPDCKTHLFRIRNIKSQEDFKKHEKDYYWQIQGNFLSSGRKRCFFIDYDDRFTKKEQQLFVIEIHRNENDIQKAKTRLNMAEKYKQNLLNIW